MTLNPIITFTTVFGIPAVATVVKSPRSSSLAIGAVFLAIELSFVLPSFRGTGILPLQSAGAF